MSTRGSSPFTVAIFVPASRGGHPRYAASLASALAQIDDFRVVYVGPTDLEFGDDLNAVEFARVLPPIRLAEQYRSRMQWALARIAFYTRRDISFALWLVRRPDIAIIHLQEEIAPWMFPLVLFIKLVRRRRFRIVATIHNIRPHETGSALSRLRQRLASISAHFFSAVFIHEGVDRVESARRLNVPVRRITPIQHGVFIEACPRPSFDSRKLLFFGGWRRNKGLAELLHALRMLEEWTLLVAGAAVDRAYADECMRIASRNVTFREGFVDDGAIAALFGEASVCVLPYTQLDAQSGVLHLAIGSGRPVVVTPVGGMASVVREYGCGVIAEGTTPRELATAIGSLAREEAFSAAIAGVERAREALGWTRAARTTADIYRRVVRAR